MDGERQSKERLTTGHHCLHAYWSYEVAGQGSVGEAFRETSLVNGTERTSCQPVQPKGEVAFLVKQSLLVAGAAAHAAVALLIDQSIDQALCLQRPLAIAG